MTEPYQPSPLPGAHEQTAFAPVVTEEYATVGATYQRTLSATASSQQFMFPGTEELNPSAVFSTPGYLSPKPRRSLIAVLSPLLAAIGGVFPYMLPVAFALAVVGLRQTFEQKVAGFGAARAGLVLTIMASIIWLLFLLANQTSLR